MQRQIVEDDLGRSKGLLPKGFRKAPAGNFEAGPRDAQGIRHVIGIFHVATVRFATPKRGQLKPEELYGVFPLSWL